MTRDYKKQSFLPGTFEVFGRWKWGMKRSFSPPRTIERVRKEKKKKRKEKKNACSYNVDTKRCTFCTLNLYKHCLFSCSSYFKCQGGCCFQQGNVSGCTCQASSSLWCQRNNFERGARKQHHLPAHDLYKSFQCYLFLGLPGKLKHKERRGEKHI